MRSTLEPTPDGRMPYFPALDGVRAYCVLLVMFDHLKSNGHGPGWIDGHLGVDLFFVISGFLITTLLVREHHFTGHIDRRAFFLRRVFRIVPVYLMVMLLYVLVLQAPSQAARWVQFRAGLPWFVTLMNEFAREPGRGTVFLQTWSLGVEEKFYLVWPFLLAGGSGASTGVVVFGFVWGDGCDGRFRAGLSSAGLLWAGDGVRDGLLADRGVGCAVVAAGSPECGVRAVPGGVRYGEGKSRVDCGVQCGGGVLSGDAGSAGELVVTAAWECAPGVAGPAVVLDVPGACALLECGGEPGGDRLCSESCRCAGGGLCAYGVSSRGAVSRYRAAGAELWAALAGSAG